MLVWLTASLCVCQVEPLSTQKELKTEKCFGVWRQLKYIKCCSLLTWQWTTRANLTSFSFSLKKNSTNYKQTFANITKRKKGSRFGLTKVLLAEGDAPFPFVRHRNTSLRRTLLLRKIMMLAQKDRENSKQQKTQNGELNDCQLSHSTAFWLPLGVWAGNTTLDWTDVFNHGVLSSRTCLRSRWRCDACACACKGLALSAVLSCKEMICHENKT